MMVILEWSIIKRCLSSCRVFMISSECLLRSSLIQLSSRCDATCDNITVMVHPTVRLAGLSGPQKNSHSHEPDKEGLCINRAAAYLSPTDFDYLNKSNVFHENVHSGLFCSNPPFCIKKKPLNFQ